MKQKTIATRHLRTKIAAGYVLILFVIFGIVYIWLNEQHRRQELEITSQKIRCLRKDVQVQLSQRTYRQRLPAAG